jgi:hypothetical protein
MNSTDVAIMQQGNTSPVFIVVPTVVISVFLLWVFWPNIYNYFVSKVAV